MGEVVTNEELAKWLEVTTAKRERFEELHNTEWIDTLRAQLDDYSRYTGDRLRPHADHIGLNGCVLVAAAVVDTMMRDPVIVANAIMHLDKHHRDQIRVLLDKLADVGM